METWLPGEPRVASLLEAAYRVDLDEQTWSDGLFRAFSPSVPGAILTAGFVFDASSEHQFHVRAMTISNPEAAGQVLNIQRQASVWTIEQMFPTAARVDSAQAILKDRFSSVRSTFDIIPEFHDAWSVAGANLARQGVLLSVTVPATVGSFPSPLLKRWHRIAAHLSAAFCLRENMARGLAPSEGILAPDGKLLHAEGPARLPDARHALRLAVRNIDAARSRFRHDPESSLQAWQAVVSGRWSLVEQHERDGKRFLLARFNDLQAPGDKALSTRERQVLGLVAQGASNKEISYRLGIGEPSVAGYLRRGRLKVGLKNRADLLRWWQQQATREE